MNGMPSMVSMCDGAQEIGKKGKGDWADVLTPAQLQGSQDPESLFQIY